MAFELRAGKGHWAAITGASSGFGEVYVRRLARLGYRLLMHGRNEERLRKLAAEIGKQHGVEVRIVIADLALDSGIDSLVGELRRLDGLRLLINNAGYGDPGLIQERTVESMLAMLRVHNEAVVRLTHAAVPLLIATGSAAVVNVSSVAAWLPGRGNVMYYATKAFLNAFSRSLAADLKDTGVVVQALCPGLTHTGFHDEGKPAYLDKSRTPRWMWMKAGAVVDISLRRLGRGRVLVIPGLHNRIFAWVGGHDWLYVRLMGSVRRK